jgi:hypothetical protein
MEERSVICTMISLRLRLCSQTARDSISFLRTLFTRRLSSDRRGCFEGQTSKNENLSRSSLALTIRRCGELCVYSLWYEVSASGATNEGGECREAELGLWVVRGCWKVEKSDDEVESVFKR